MTTQYNPQVRAFQTKGELMESEGSMSFKVTENGHHAVECDPTKLTGSHEKFVRNNPTPPGQDIQKYDHGNLNLAIAGIASEYAYRQIGELWVTYTVTLRKPKLYSALGTGIGKDLLVSGGNETFNAPWGSEGLFLYGQQNNIGCKFTKSGPDLVITFPKWYQGTVQILCTFESSSNSFVGLAPITSIINFAHVGNISTFTEVFGANGDGSDSPSQAIRCGAGSVVVQAVRYKLSPATGSGENIVTLSSTQLTAGTVTQCMIEITEINPGFGFDFLNMGSSNTPVLVNASGQLVNLT